MERAAPVASCQGDYVVAAIAPRPVAANGCEIIAGDSIVRPRIIAADGSNLLLPIVSAIEMLAFSALDNVSQCGFCHTSFFKLIVQLVYYRLAKMDGQYATEMTVR